MGLSQYANFELGEAFFEMVSKMVIRDGIPFPHMEPFDMVSPKWRQLADKENKTPEELKKLDVDYKTEIIDMADSYTIFISAKTGNKSYNFTLDDYKKFVEQTGLFAMPKDASQIETHKKNIETRFRKLANHGEKTGDNIIDNKDIAAYIYALDLKSEKDENNNFKGFYLNGKITPMNYALAYKMLFDENETLFDTKLRHAYINLFGS